MFSQLDGEIYDRELYFTTWLKNTAILLFLEEILLNITLNNEIDNSVLKELIRIGLCLENLRFSFWSVTM